MIRNYLKIAWRNLLYYKVFSLLNIAGLALGMVVSLLIGLWVLDELSYDRFHANAPRILRMTATVGDMQAAVTPTRMAPALTAQLPIIKTAVRLKQAQEVVAVGNLRFDEKRVYYVDPALLAMFSFDLEQGNPKQALSQPTGVVITRQTALKYFGTTQALGKIIRIFAQQLGKCMISILNSAIKIRNDSKVEPPIISGNVREIRNPYLTRFYRLDLAV